MLWLLLLWFAPTATAAAPVRFCPPVDGGELAAELGIGCWAAAAGGAELAAWALVTWQDAGIGDWLANNVTDARPFETWFSCAFTVRETLTDAFKQWFVVLNSDKLQTPWNTNELSII